MRPGGDRRGVQRTSDLFGAVKPRMFGTGIHKRGVLIVFGVTAFSTSAFAQTVAEIIERTLAAALPLSPPACRRRHARQRVAYECGHDVRPKPKSQLTHCIERSGGIYGAAEST